MEADYRTRIPARLYVRHPSSADHDTGGHPENARRLVAIEEAMAERDWLEMELVEAPAATRTQLARVHDERHIDSIEQLAARGGGMIDLDTVASAGSWEAALHSAGGAVHAAELLLARGAPDDARARDSATREMSEEAPSEVGFAFCGLRPPGHHAEGGRAMGFCLFNNVAVAAAHALAELGIERVLVLDWDVHHGNGTEAIFYGSPQVLYASIHQSPLYPGTGAATDLGSGDGEGFTVNLPVPPGSGPDEFLGLVQHVVAPIARDWRPQLICISAGYDAHREDPLANCELDERGYRDMAATMRQLATELGAPLLVCLEGGYALGALARSVVATLDGLGDQSPAREADDQPAAAYRSRLAPYWKLLS